MESSPLKKPRLDPEKTIEKKNDSVLCEEIVEYMDKVGNTASVNSNIPDGSMVQKACHSKENPTHVEQLFELFFKVTDRKPNKMQLGKELVPANYHQWGSLAKIKEKSVTLRDLTIHDATLERLTNFKDTFIAILEELEFKYSIVKLNSLKPKKIQCVFAFDVRSTPEYSFYGTGPSEIIAINAAAKHGITFFVASCQ